MDFAEIFRSFGVLANKGRNPFIHHAQTGQIAVVKAVHVAHLNVFKNDLPLISAHSSASTLSDMEKKICDFITEKLERQTN